MEHIVAVFVGILSIVTYLSEVASLDEKRRILRGETESLSAKVLDIESEIASIAVQRSKKRKRDDCRWKFEGQGLVKKAEHLLRPVGGWRSFLLGVKMRWDADKLLRALKAHDGMGDLLLRQALSDARGPCCGLLLPVKQVVGQVTSNTLDRLKAMLEGDKVARIAIHGIEGIGKTFLMKHLHNYALNMFDYVFWVASPDEFTIERVQDAVAAVVKCDFSSDDHWSVRAKKLSDAFANLGRFALFLDGVPKAEFSLEQVGIPVPATGSECKLVVSTTNTTIFPCFERVEIKPLPKVDAYELFKRETNIGEESVSSLNGIPSLLADRCSGVPCRILNIATRLCGINDPHEWKYTLYELEHLGKKKKKRPLFHLGESEITSSTRKLRSTRISKE